MQVTNFHSIFYHKIYSLLISSSIGYEGESFNTLLHELATVKITFGLLLYMNVRVVYFGEADPIPYNSNIQSIHPHEESEGTRDLKVEA